jgi:hypothetical protein
MSLKFAAAVAAMMIGSAPGYAAGLVNLVTNGDFESTAYGAGGSGQISPTNGTQDVNGWTISGRTGNLTTPGLGFVFASGQGDKPSNGAGAYLYGPGNTTPINNGLTANSGATTTGGYTGQAGGNYIALDADPVVSGTLSQSISGLVVGTGYALTFEWATAELQANNVQVQTTEYLQVSLGGQTQTTASLTTAAAGFDPWRQATLYFTATSTNEVLSFLAIGAPSGDPPTVLLDAVSLTVPEPSTWVVMLVGITGLAGLTAMRRRSRNASIAA